jgi:hypothetical protein
MSAPDLESLGMNVIKLASDTVRFASEMIRDGGGPLIVFALIQTETDVHVVNFMGAPEEALVTARRHIQSSGSSIAGYSLAFDAVITVDGKKQDAIVVELGDRKNANGVVVCQSYSPAESENGFSLLSNVRPSASVGASFRGRLDVNQAEVSSAILRIRSGRLSWFPL